MTPGGLSKEENTGTGVVQCTLEGTICYAANIDDRIKDEFPDGEKKEK